MNRLLKKLPCMLTAATLTAVLGASHSTAAPIAAALWDFESDSGAPIAAGSTASRSFDGSAANAGADGFDTGVDADGIPGFGGTAPFTVVATFQIDNSQNTSNANNAIFGYSPSNGTIAGGDLRFYAQKDGQVRVEASAGAGSEVTLGGINVYDGQPHDIAIVAAGGENFNDLDIYLDGTLYLNPLSAGNNALVNLLGSGDTIEIGVDRPTFENRFFGGLIDDLAIYTSALSEQDLQGVFANGVAIPEPSSLVLLFCGLMVVGCHRK